MNKRKQVIRALQNLEHQFLLQQQQVGQHASYLFTWYAKNRFQLGIFMATISLGVTYLVQKLEKRPHTSGVWLKRFRFGLVWLLDFFALNPQAVRGFLTHFLAEKRRLNAP